MASFFSRTSRALSLLSYRSFSASISRQLAPGRCLVIRNGRTFSFGLRRYCSSKAEIAKKPAGSSSVSTKEHSAGVGIPDKFHHPSNAEKKMLVWTGAYSNIESIPRTVSHQAILRAKDMMRVYITIGIVIFSAVGAVIILLMSRHARDQGDSLTKRKLEWKKALEEQGKKEREEAARKAQEAQAK